MSAGNYSSRMLARARKLAEGEWQPVEIRQRLVREFGVAPSLTTIRVWTDDRYAAERRTVQAAAKRRESARRRGVDFRELSDDVLLALRVEDGLTYPAISNVVRRFYAVDIDPEDMRRRLHELGAPKNPNKARVRSAA